jgi:hypothetical protein
MVKKKMVKIKKKVKQKKIGKIVRHSAKPIKRECAKCHKDIKEGEHYFLIREFKDKKQISEKFVHKICPDPLDDIFRDEISGKDNSKELIEGDNDDKDLNLFEHPIAMEGLMS